MKPLRILMLNHNQKGVGSYFRCWHPARQLARLGHEVCLLTVSRTARAAPRMYHEDGVKVVETPNLLDLLYGFGAGYGVLGIPYRMVWAARNSFDIVHAVDHKPNVLLPAIVRSRLKDIPLVADWADWWGPTTDGSGLQERRAWPVARLETAMEEYIYRVADWVTTISAGLRDRAIRIGVPPDKVRWIPSGAPDDIILPEDRNTCRRSLGIPSASFLLGYVGSDMADLGMIIPLLRDLRKKQPRLKLALIGPLPGLAGLLEADVRASVLHFGAVPFPLLSQYLGSCDAMVLPLRSTVFNKTRWPNKFGDYLAAGRPVLCSPVGDVPDFVKSEECGIVWNDLSELAAGVELLMENPSLASQMGERARQLAEGRLSWKELVLEFLEVYSNVGA